MYITGPQVIKAVTGKNVTSEQIGGARAHNQTSGVAHFFAASENECYEQVRKTLSYLPSNNLEEPPLLGLFIKKIKIISLHHLKKKIILI